MPTKLSSLLAAVILSLLTPISGNANPADIQQCLQTSLAQVLSGSGASKHINFKRVVYRVYGPPARALSASNLDIAAKQLAEVMQSAINKERRRFRNPTIRITYLKQSARYTNAYGVEGVVSADGDYNFAVNGYFYSATQCELHGIWIQGARSMVEFLKDQPEVKQLCEQLTKQRC